MEVHITLYGDAAELFEEIREDLADERGMEPGNAETARHLMAESDRPRDPRGTPRNHA